MDRYVRDKTVRPSLADAALLAELKSRAYAILPTGFEVVELSPLAPFGVVSALTNLDQNNALATIANTEVSSDPTNVLALECAVRRKERPIGEGSSDSRVRLCAFHRCVRAQAAVGPTTVAHFELLALCSAGSASPEHSFESNALLDHIGYYLRLFTKAQDMGFRTPGVRVTLSNFGRGEDRWLREKVALALGAGQGRPNVVIDPDRHAGRNYYTTAAFQIHATDREGRDLNLVDGGMVDWTQQLLANRKERLLISGFGVERYLTSFKV
jgi:hypothetical protein